MRKTGYVLLCVVCVVLCYLTISSAKGVFQFDWQVPEAAEPDISQNRLILITKNLDTPFWDEVSQGAMEEAARTGASLEIWGSYGDDQADFLKKIEIAIYSKVDGLIVQGLDTEEFKELTKNKASAYGVPVITVANDVPMEESLRKTYVGSDQFAAGQLIAEQLVNDMGTEGKVIIMSNSGDEYYQRQRIAGIQEVFQYFPDIQPTYAKTGDSTEQVIAATQDMLNKVPDAAAFIAVDADFSKALTKEIGKRFQIEPFHIYTFDDGPDLQPLLSQRKLDGIIQQSPKTMGAVSVKLMMEWLTGKTVPLERNGHFTDIRVSETAEES